MTCGVGNAGTEPSPVRISWSLAKGSGKSLHPQKGTCPHPMSTCRVGTVPRKQKAVSEHWLLERGQRPDCRWQLCDEAAFLWDLFSLISSDMMLLLRDVLA